MDAGFDLFGVCAAQPLEQEREHLQAWLHKGYAGQMSYLEKNFEKRLDPRLILASVKSIICLGISYYYDPAGNTGTRSQFKKLNWVMSRISGTIARYAWGRDYHKVLRKKLKVLKAQIIALAGPQTELMDYTDTGPLMERQAATLAGLGFTGKNTLLLHPQHGSYFFLSEILTNLDLTPGDPVTVSCGSCRKCLDACPTQAFPEAYVLDATRCIAYWTIEARGDIPAEFHEAIGDHVFGCDICQQVCPFNREPLPSRCEEFSPTQGPGPTLDFQKIEAMNEASFHATYQHSSLTRTKFSGIMRNIEIVKENEKNA